MIFLSRLQLGPGDLRVARDLADVTQMHRTLMRGFPQTDVASPRQAFGVLFRTEVTGPRRVVIVQSALAPEWDRLGAGYLVASEVKDITEPLEGLASGRILRFLLVANPSRKSVLPRPGEPPRSNSRRLALSTDEERHRWLAGRGERCGFSLVGAGAHDGVRISPVTVMPRRGPRSDIVVRPVRFEGRLRVDEPERLREAVRAGIGPAKAYGCGLLSVAPG